MGLDGVGMGVAPPMNPYMMYMTGMNPMMGRPYGMFATNVMGAGGMGGMGTMPGMNAGGMPGMGAGMNTMSGGMNTGMGGMGQVRPNAPNPYGF